MKKLSLGKIGEIKKFLKTNRFIDRDLPREVRRRYFWKTLEIEDIIRYGLYDEMDRGRASRNKKTVDFFEKVKPDDARLLEPDLFDYNLRTLYSKKLETI